MYAHGYADGLWNITTKKLLLIGVRLDEFNSNKFQVNE